MTNLELAFGAIGFLLGAILIHLWKKAPPDHLNQENTDNQLLRLALHAAGAGTMFFDAQKNKHFWDFKTSEMFGLGNAYQQVEPGIWESIIHPEDIEIVLTKIDQAAKDNGEFDIEYRLIKTNGKISYIRSVGYAETDINGKIQKIQSINFDLTPQKLKEQALKKAKEEATHLAEVKGKFLAMMSHEIRTPMNGILGMADLLNETQLTPQQKVCTQTLKQSGDQLLGILNDILDFSKYQSGNLKLESVEFSLREALRQVLNLYTQTARKKKVFFTCWINPNVPDKVLGDPLRFSQILNNLINNAFKFTGEGFVFVWIDLEVINKGRMTINLHVKDSGVGIGKNYLPKIFESFTQQDNSTRRKFGGTGLGLSIVKSIISAWGGKIRVESEPGEGTDFRIELPVQYQQQNLSRSVTQSVMVASTIQSLLLSLQTYNHQNLTHFGYADSAESLILQLDQVRWHLLILDSKFLANQSEDLLSQITKKYPDLSYFVIDNHSDTNVPTQNLIQMPFAINDLLEQRQEHLPSVAESDNSSASKTGLNEAIEISDLNSVSALIVDDNAINRMVLKKMLNKLKVRTDEADDGKSALYKCEINNFDLVFMDFEMPGMNGTEVTRILRARGFKSPIMGVSAHAMKEYEDQALRAGMNDFLAKPIRMEKLKTAVQKVKKSVVN